MEEIINMLGSLFVLLGLKFVSTAIVLFFTAFAFTSLDE